MPKLTQAQALELDADLRELKALRENRVWKNHLIPELLRRQADHRTGMNDRTLPPAERCEHVTAWELATAMLEFLDKQEHTLRAALHEHDLAQPILTRGFGDHP